MGDSPHAKTLRPNSLGRAQILTDLINDNSPTIILLQEAHRGVLSYANLRQYDLFDGPSNLVTLISKNKYSIIDNISHENHFHLLALDSLFKDEKGLKIINLHLPTLHKDEGEKQEYIRKRMPAINVWRTKYEPRFEIMGGDFNIPPYNAALIEETGVFANRDIRHASTSTSTFGFGKALYNTSWQIFGGACGALGTYYQNKLPHGPWHIPDQIMLDPELVKQSIVSVKVITEANKKSFKSKIVQGPNKDVASDHFPVLVSVEMI